MLSDEASKHRIDTPNCIGYSRSDRRMAARESGAMQRPATESAGTGRGAARLVVFGGVTARSRLAQ